MIVRALLRDVTEQLTQAGVEGARKDAALLLMAAWGISATSLVIKMLDEAPHKVVVQCSALLERRLNREPMAYILGVKSFWKDEFVVTSDVLIPRPETEHLIEMVLKHLPKQQEMYQIADIGTGSGCIGLTLAKEYPHSRVTACDISHQALTIAKINAENMAVGQRIDFYQGDLYQALPSSIRFDVIVSNPPYVSSDEMLEVAQELSFEPRFALTDEATGLTLLEVLLQEAHHHLKVGGLLVLESGLCGMPNTPQTLQKIEDYHDLAGNFRGTVFRLRSIQSLL